MADKTHEKAVCTIEKIGKSFRSSVVLQECSFSLLASEVVLLMGKNGAGKSTLLRLLAGLTPIASGDVHWQEENIGYLAQDLQLYSSLTVAENLDFFTKIRKQSDRPDLERWGLAPLKDEPLHNLSKGLKQRVSLCRLFSQGARYLLLDEPTTHLDMEGIEIFKEALTEQRAASKLKGALLVSHDIFNCQGVVDRALVLQAGNIQHDSHASESLETVIAAYREVNR